MISYNIARPYVIYPGFLIPQNSKKSTMILYYSENSTFMDDFQYLGLRRIDFRYVIVPTTRMPRTFLNGVLIKKYKDECHLIAKRSDQPIPENQNYIYDCTEFIYQVDKKYKPKTYRQRFGNLLQQAVEAGFRGGRKYRKILFYSVCLDKPFSESYVNRKIFPFITQLKAGTFIFDDMVLCLITPNGSHYRILVKDREYTYTRIKQYIKNIAGMEEIGEEIKSDQKIERISKQIVSTTTAKIKDEHKEAVTDAVKNLITIDPTLVDEFSSGLEKKSISTEKSDELVSIAILAANNGDATHSRKLVKDSIANKTPKEVVAMVNKNLTQDLLVYQKPIVDNDSEALHGARLDVATGNRSVDHILDKRKKDFQENLVNDIKQLFVSLSNKEIPLNIKTVKFIEIAPDLKDLARTDLTTIEVILVDTNKKEHKIELKIPRIDEDGTFWINGKRKCLLNQIIQLPITFPKPFMSKFESSYSAFHIYSRALKGGSHLEIYMGSSTLPFPHVMFFGFGFEYTLKLLSLKYKKQKSITKDDEYYIKVNDEEFLVFDKPAKTDELRKQFLYTIMKYPMKPIGKLYIFDKEYWPKLMIKETGRANSVYHMQNNFENVVDSVSRQILMTKALPTRLDNIMLYMASKTVLGYTLKRNDLNNQRIRSSEIVVHLLQKQVLSAYTIYKERILAGDEDAKLEIPSTKLLSEFVTSEIVANMEYANPVEELSMMVRVSPIGKNIGGIPDKQAISNDARNLSESYYGNLDPVDTPEGGGVGITQHLTLGAAITSSRGLFKSQDYVEGLGSGILSPSSVLVPFVQNNDGNRVMFGVGQMKQAVPLSNPQPPAVQSGFESILTNSLSDHFIKRAPCDGEVVEINDNSIIVKCNKTKKQEKVDTTPVHLGSGSGLDTLSTFKTKVKVGDKVKQKQRIAEGGCIKDGFIAMGRMLCTAAMSYKGYNFEDGIVINENVIKDGKMISEHGIVEEIYLAPSDKILFIEKIGTETIKGQTLLQKTIGELDQLLGYDEDDETILEEISGSNLIRKSPGGKIVDIEVFSNISENKEPELLKPLIKRTNNIIGQKAGVYKTKDGPIKGILIRFKITQKINIGVGDKLTNRHGAKGIVSLVEQDKYMPITPWGDKVEIIVNPVGIINRMNIGQLYELYCGLISKGLALFIIKNRTNKVVVVNMIKRVLGALDKTEKKTIVSSILANVASMGQNRFDLFVKEMETNPFFPIIVPPFKSPKIADIRAALGFLGFQSQYNVKLPEFGVKTLQPVSLGYMYVEKLEHIASLKLHARSTGAMTNKTLQPPAGKRRGGGQRVGEQDVYSLLSHNCYTTLQEVFGAMSDDIPAKKAEIANIMRTGQTNLERSKTSPTRELLNCYFTAMMLERK